jgi:hypothetical protein
VAGTYKNSFSHITAGMVAQGDVTGSDHRRRLLSAAPANTTSLLKAKVPMLMPTSSKASKTSGIRAVLNTITRENKLRTCPTQAVPYTSATMAPPSTQLTPADTPALTQASFTTRSSLSKILIIDVAVAKGN